MKRNTVEVVMLGDDNSGKTALMRALDHQPFLETLPPSKDPGFLNNPVLSANDPDPSISLRVVDVPNTHDPYGGKNLRRNFLRTADAVVICLESTEASSFADAKKIYESIQGQYPDRVQVCFVGTKADMPRTEHSVSQGEVLQYADLMNAKYVSCSAKTGQGVEQVFETVKSQVLESRAPKLQTVSAASNANEKMSSTKKPPLSRKILGKITTRTDSISFEKKIEDSKSLDKESKPILDPNPNTVEIVLSGIKLSQEQRAELKAMSMHSDAYLMSQTAFFNEKDLNVGSTDLVLKSGAKMTARTDQGGNVDKITIIVRYNDENATKTMQEVADRIFNVAVTQQDTLEIRTSHDEKKLLAKALENRSLQPKEEVYRVNIQGMSQDLNKYGPPAFFDSEAIHKKLIQDPVTKDLKSLQQSVMTLDGKGVMTASANYLPPDQDNKQGARLANQIQVELRPNAGQFLDANTVKAFQTEIERMRQGGTVQVDASNPKEFNDLLMPQPQAQQAVQVAGAVPQQLVNPLPVQEEKAFRRASRMPPIPLSRQKSIGELESFSPRDNQSDNAKSHPKLEKAPTSENVLAQVEEMTDKLFESPRGEVATLAEKSPMIQRLQSQSTKTKSDSAVASTKDAESAPPKMGK